MPVVRVFLHTAAAAQELARARAAPVKALLGEAITVDALRELTEIDVRPETTARVYRKGRARFDEPMLPMEFAIDGKTKQSLKAAAKRLGCPIARICRALADRYLGGLLHASR